MNDVTEQENCIDNLKDFLEDLELDSSILSSLVYDFLLEHELCGLKPIESLRFFLKKECKLIFTQPKNNNFALTKTSHKSYFYLKQELERCNFLYFGGRGNLIEIKKELLKEAIELGAWGYFKANPAIDHGIQTYISTHKIVPGEIYPTFAKDIECYGLPVDEEEVKKLKGALSRKQMTSYFLDTLYDFSLGFERDISSCQRLMLLENGRWIIGSYAIKNGDVAYLYDPLDPSREIATLGQNSIVKFA